MTEKTTSVQTHFPGYDFRPARREDAESIVQLILDIEAVDQRGWAYTVEDSHREFTDPSTNFETDTWLGFTDQGQLVALGWVFSQPVGRTEYIAHLWGEVHPHHRGRGLGTYLLAWMEARGRAILETRPPNLPHILRISSPDNLHDRIALFEQHGFRHVRSYYKMRRDLSQPIPDERLPEGLVLQTWSPEIDHAAFEAFNEAFSDHWGFNTISEDHWRLWLTGHPNFYREQSFFVFDGDQMAAFSINQVRTADNAQSGIKEAWIADIGTRRPWRRRGIASALMCISMRAFQAAGFDYATLGVDAENVTGALHIYERLGFKVIKRTMAFYKNV